MDSLERKGFFVYVFDACGVRVELEEDLDLPEELRRAPPPHQRRAFIRTLNAKVPPSVLETMRKRVGELCVLSTMEADPQGGRIYEPTPELVRDCKARMKATLLVLGAEVDEEKEAWRYWFQAGDWVFHSSRRLRPPCKGSVLDSSRTACEKLDRPESGAGTRRQMAEGRETGDYLHDGFYARIDAGATSASVDGNQIADFQGGFLDTALSVGGSPVFGLVFGASIVNQRAFEGSGAPIIAAMNLFSSYYPWPKEGYHFDVSVGLGGVSRIGVESLEFKGGILGAGVGYEIWITEQMSFGLTGRGSWMVNGSENGSLTTLGLVGSFTYH